MKRESSSTKHRNPPLLNGEGRERSLREMRPVGRRFGGNVNSSHGNKLEDAGGGAASAAQTGKKNDDVYRQQQSTKQAATKQLTYDETISLQQLQTKTSEVIRTVGVRRGKNIFVKRGVLSEMKDGGGYLNRFNDSYTINRCTVKIQSAMRGKIARRKVKEMRRLEGVELWSKGFTRQGVDLVAVFCIVKVSACINMHALSACA